MKEMEKGGLKQDSGKLSEGISASTPYNPGHDASFFLPEGGGENSGSHPAKKQPHCLYYIQSE